MYGMIRMRVKIGYFWVSWNCKFQSTLSHRNYSACSSQLCRLLTVFGIVCRMLTSIEVLTYDIYVITSINKRSSSHHLSSPYSLSHTTSIACMSAGVLGPIMSVALGISHADYTHHRTWYKSSFVLVCQWCESLGWRWHAVYNTRSSVKRCCSTQSWPLYVTWQSWSWVWWRLWADTQRTAEVCARLILLYTSV